VQPKPQWNVLFWFVLCFVVPPLNTTTSPPGATCGSPRLDMPSACAKAIRVAPLPSSAAVQMSGPFFQTIVASAGAAAARAIAMPVAIEVTERSSGVDTAVLPFRGCDAATVRSAERAVVSRDGQIGYDRGWRSAYDERLRRR
jgi:hypothetical protein